MAKSKERPLDRYPYMENNLKGWDNWFVTNEVYAVNQKIIHDRLDYLQDEIDNIEVHGYVTDEEFNEYKTEVTGNFTTINNQITSINTTLNNLPNIYVTDEEFNEYKTEVTGNFTTINNQITSINTTLNNLPNIYVTQEEYNTYVTNTATTLTSLDGRITANETAIQSMETDISNLETDVANLKIKRITLTTNNPVSDTTVPNYKFSQEFNVPGVTDNTFPDGYVDYNITGRVLIETLTDKIKLYFATKPPTTARVVVIYHNTYA